MIVETCVIPVRPAELFPGSRVDLLANHVVRPAMPFPAGGESHWLLK